MLLLPSLKRHARASLVGRGGDELFTFSFESRSPMARIQIEWPHLHYQLQQSSAGDSPLSTTASIVGILTFALGLLASYIALQSATRGAPSEIARLVDDLRITQHEINRVAEYIFDDTHNVPVRISRMLASAKPLQYTTDEHSVQDTEATTIIMQGLHDEVEALLGDCVRLFYEADDLLKKSESNVSRWDPEGLRRRITYVMNRHEVAEKMLRLEEQKQKLGDIRMSLFLRKSAMQDALLKQIAESVKEIQAWQ